MILSLIVVKDNTAVLGSVIGLDGLVRGRVLVLEPSVLVDIIEKTAHTTLKVTMDNFLSSDTRTTIVPPAKWSTLDELVLPVRASSVKDCAFMDHISCVTDL